MKNAIKILGLGLVVLITIGVIALVIINAQDLPSYETELVEFQRSDKAEAIERGQKLATMLCANCHMDRSTSKLTGQRMKDAPSEFGEIYAPNITQDKTYGIGEWTDGEIVRLLRTGIKRDGQYAPPYMAKLPLMADEDIDAIISFLRSDHPMVVAENKPDTPTKPSLLTKVLSRLAFKPFPMPEKPIPMPDTNNALQLGEYLAHNLECFSCHSADFKTNNYLNPTMSPGYFAGGNQPLDLEGRVMLTPNLTPDEATGIGSWTKEQFTNAVKYGLKEGEPPLSYPMLPYTQLTDYEVGAIYDYLMTIPPIANEVERSIYN
ncbi:c-type cytochrome [Ekhidna sp.]|uniref:c-type cytochrome n=1 Tax=Ekhidna sp. TaxID=2608089 RepID=UPI003CCC1F52